MGPQTDGRGAPLSHVPHLGVRGQQLSLLWLLTNKKVRCYPYALWPHPFCVCGGVGGAGEWQMGSRLYTQHNYTCSSQAGRVGLADNCCGQKLQRLTMFDKSVSQEPREPVHSDAYDYSTSLFASCILQRVPLLQAGETPVPRSQNDCQPPFSRAQRGGTAVRRQISSTTPLHQGTTWKASALKPPLPSQVQGGGGRRLTVAGGRGGGIASWDWCGPHSPSPFINTQRRVPKPRHTSRPPYRKGDHNPMRRYPTFPRTCPPSITPCSHRSNVFQRIRAGQISWRDCLVDGRHISPCCPIHCCRLLALPF